MMRDFVRTAACALVGVLCVSAAAKTAPKARRTKALGPEIATLLADPAVAQAHWGIAVTTMDGTPIYSMNEAQLFQPASNAKLFTTAAAMALLGPGTTYETRVMGKGVFGGAQNLTGDLVLVGDGDANLSGREIPYLAPALRPKAAPGATPLAEGNPLRHLEELADQVAKTGLKVVNGDVVGDDTLFPWEPYAEDWTIDDAVWGYGAPVSALSINDNQIKMTVTPGDTAGKSATVMVDPAVPYYTVDVSGLLTGPAKSESHVQMERALGSKMLRVYGSIALDAQPDVEEVAIQDPAGYAAVALKGMLEERGIVVTGVARALHKEATNPSGFMTRVGAPGEEHELVKSGLSHGDCLASPLPTPPLPGTAVRALASHRSPALVDDVMVTNKVSQNLHAELWLHHLGRRMVCGDGSAVDGARLVRAFLEEAGVEKDDFVFFDGSGLSGHDLVAPRATARLLQYASTQPWFADWKKSLPVGGEDGSLAERFAKAPLKDHVFAKTGTLGEARALSGYLDCASGKTVIFSIMVGNHLPQTHADRDVMDRIVEAIAAAN
jgi:D-alanyl-D-alanine carboxypeptidase/D-alanyl-D-alanine-endopeptidase (penicillin-binding protein 4)